MIPILTLAIVWFIIFLILVFVGRKQLNFLKSKTTQLTKQKKSEVLKFVQEDIQSLKSEFNAEFSEFNNDLPNSKSSIKPIINHINNQAKK